MKKLLTAVLISGLSVSALANTGWYVNGHGIAVAGDDKYKMFAMIGKSGIISFVMNTASSGCLVSTHNEYEKKIMIGGTGVKATVSCNSDIKKYEFTPATKKGQDYTLSAFSKSNSTVDVLSYSVSAVNFGKTLTDLAAFHADEGI